MSIDFIKSVYYELISYLIPKKQRYEITGECLQCGECCRQIRSYGLKNENELKLMQFILPWYKRFYISGADSNGELILSCKYLNNDGKCGVYEKRPAVCRNYPAKTINFNAGMIDGCGYKVIKKEFKDYL